MDDFFVRNRLSAYLDGELPAAEAREVESALAADPSLRAEYEALREAAQLLRDHGPIRAPDRFAAALDARLAREPMPTGWRRWARSVRPEVYAIAAVAALAILVVGRSRTGDPVAEVPVTAPVATTKDGPPPEDAGGQPGEIAAAGGGDAATTGAPPTTGNDGVLGDEGFAAAKLDAERKRASGPPGYVAPTPSSVPGAGGRIVKGSGVEKEAYQPSWETDPEYTVIRGDTIVQTGAVPQEAAPAVAQQQTGNTGTMNLYSPPPFRYRVRSGDETNLKQLAALASSLGGKLVDEAGRPVALHMLDQGEVKVVRVILPSGAVERLTQQLGAMGDVETMAADRSALYPAGSAVPVEVELERE